MFSDIETYCMFIGYPRSGHTLVGSLLNAHPEALISHELDALSLLREGGDRDALFRAIVEADRSFAERERHHTDYDYNVPGSWHGRWERLRVIGDKKGGRSSWWLHDEPELLDRLYEVVSLPVRFIHVSRSPWDNIATITRRGHTHEDAISWYFDTCEAVVGIRSRIPSAHVFDLRHEDLIADPAGEMQRLAAFLGLDAPAPWIQACAARVNPAPNRSRHELTWSDPQIERVSRAVRRFPWFRPEDAEYDAVDPDRSGRGL